MARLLADGDRSQEDDLKKMLEVLQAPMPLEVAEHLHAHDVLFIGYPQNDPRCVVDATVAQKGRKYRELAQQLIVLSDDEALGDPVAGIDGVHAKSVARALMGLHRYVHAPESVIAYMPLCSSLNDIVAAKEDPIIRPPPNKVKKGRKKYKKRMRSRGELTVREIATHDDAAGAAAAAAAAAAPIVSPFATRSGKRRM